MFIVTFETLNAQPLNTRLLGNNLNKISAFRIDTTAEDLKIWGNDSCTLAQIYDLYS